MARGFSLTLCPVLYRAQYTVEGSWQQSYSEKVCAGAAAADPGAQAGVGGQGDAHVGAEVLPLINYSTQYGYGCFEGLKAFPQHDGRLKLFRPGENAKRMYRSMIGLRMPGFPEQMFTAAVVELVRRNHQRGACPRYNPDWEANGFMEGDALYLRPFSYSEAGIGLNIPCAPWVVIIATPVGSYFDPQNGSKAITTTRIRATEGGTGWIKCCSNYVIPILAKREAQERGYMEAIFLDAKERRYVEEGSSCNIFFYMRDGTLVTPSLEDRILPGITRKSVIELARDDGVAVEERLVEIGEAMDRSVECFVTGTAAGVEQIESITHEGRTAVLNNHVIGDLTRRLRDRLKGIQYGAVEDRHGWMVAAT